MMLGMWLLSLVGCDMLPTGEPAEPACDLSIDTLAGRTFVYLEAMPDKSERPNPIARVKFVDGDGGLEARYTVGSLSDVYTYPCSVRGEGDDTQLYCAEEPRPRDWCQALLVADATCTKKALRKLGAEGTDDELNAAIKEAKETVRKYRDTDDWRQFALNNNNLGNKLQGRLYIKVNQQRCRLNVGDYYWTIHNGEEVEDSNPVGQNPFVEAEAGEWLFEHCTDGRNLPGIATEELPDDLSTIPARRTYSLGDDIWFHYLGESAQEAEEGCTYQFDTWANWKPVAEDVEAPVVDGAVQWRFQHTFEEGVQPIGVPAEAVTVTMRREKVCGGEPEVIDVVCEGALVQ